MKKSELKNIISEEIRIALLSENTDEVVTAIQRAKAEGRLDPDAEEMVRKWLGDGGNHEAIIDFLNNQKGGSIKEAKYPSFEVDSNIKYQDKNITKGYWIYMGQERAGSGLYKNIMNNQTYGFYDTDLDYFRKHLKKNIEVIDESINEIHKLFRQTYLSPAEYEKAKKLKGFDPKNYTWDNTKDLYKKNESVNKAQLNTIIKNIEKFLPNVKLDHKKKIITFDEVDIKKIKPATKIFLKALQDKYGYTMDIAVESVNEYKDIYSKFLDDPTNPKGRAKALISKFLKWDGTGSPSSMSVDRYSKINNLTPEEKYILKYITKNDIKITSQPGGPDFSVFKESVNEDHDCEKVHPKQTHDEWLDQITKDQIEHDEETLRKERGLEEVTSKKQKQWACSQINSKNRPKGLSKAEAEEMCRSKVKEAILKALNSQ